MAHLALLDGRDFPEVQRRRANLYLSAFCALGLTFQIMASTDSHSRGFESLVWLLSLGVGAMALMLLRRSHSHRSVSAWPHPRPSSFVNRPQTYSSRHYSGRLVERLLTQSAKLETPRMRIQPVDLTRSDMPKLRLHIPRIELPKLDVSKLFSQVRRLRTNVDLAALPRRLSSRLGRAQADEPVSEETLESFVSWRSDRIQRSSPASRDLAKLSSEPVGAGKQPAKPAEAPATSSPDPWSKALAQFDGQSDKHPRRHR